MIEADSPQENNQSQHLPDTSELIESILAAAIDGTEQELIDAAIASENLQVSDGAGQETIETIIVEIEKATENKTSEAIAADQFQGPDETAQQKLEARAGEVTDENREEIRSGSIHIAEDTDQRWEQDQAQVEGDISADASNMAFSAAADSTLVATNEATVHLPASEADWLALIQKLRSRNRGLLNRVTQLEKGLEECQEVIESHRQRSRSQEAIIRSTAEELTTAQEQLTRTFRELEMSHQVAQRQQILIETLTMELESSQERIAQMERECAYTAQRYNDQAHALLQTETALRELRDRLQRQQRQTLQFKSALEKCLEVPGITYEGTEAAGGSSDLSLSQRRHIQNMLAAKSLIPKAQPIQPWSAQPPAFSEDKDLEDPSWNNLGEVEPAYSESESSSQLDWLDAVLDADDNPPDQQAEEVDSELLAEQPELATIFQMIDELNQDLPPDPSIERSNLFSTNSDIESTPSSGDRAFEPYLERAEDVPVAVSTQPEAVAVGQDIDAELIGDRERTSSSQPIPNQPSWPSPVLYPQRPSRGLKSLAAVELPTFPKKSGGQ